jgi:ribosomal protein S18 acetylase RimI-like enzyme
VNKSKHNRGIGQKLFNYVLGKYHNRVLLLEVRASNDRAIHIYRKYGFEVTMSFDSYINGCIVKQYKMKRNPRLLESVGLLDMDDLFSA